MPIFLCAKCRMMENTALSHYWTRDLDAPKGAPPSPPLCSECDPEILKWHGQFGRNPLSADHVVGPDGFVYYKDDEYLKRLLRENTSRKARGTECPTGEPGDTGPAGNP